MGLPQETSHPSSESSGCVVPPVPAEKVAWIAVAAAALGYFVDVFDMWLFANFRVPSLQSLGLTAEQITKLGGTLQNYQQVGFLLGGFLWGIMGDKRGRVSVMFGSILLYSTATFLNGFVTSVEQYKLLRFITGVGLAGEIGAGITLVCELLPKDKRGYGTTIVATLGVAGAIAAAYAGKVMQWQHAYFLGGAMGFALLAMRFAVYESGMYSSAAQQDDVKRGSLRLLFLGSWSRTWRFLCCILAGVPIYLVFGIIVFFSPEIAVAMGIKEPVIVPDIMLWASIGLTVGDLFSGLLSQYLRSRKKPLAIFMGVTAVATLITFSGAVTTSQGYQIAAGIMGLFAGYWACLITMISEQFGTNLRATVTTTVPNLVRATSIPLIFGFGFFKDMGTPVTAVFTLAVISFALAFIGLIGLRETYGKNLDFVER